MPVMKVNGVGINYEIHGSGETMAFLHGYTGSGRDWAGQVEYFKDRYRLITIDHRGQGGSEAPDREEDYSIEIFSRDAFELLSNLGVNNICLAGHSMGGFTALQFALDHPDMIKALVLVDTSSGSYDMSPEYDELRATIEDLARNEGLEAAFKYDAANNPVRIARFERHPEQKELARRKVMQTSVDGYIYAHRTFSRWKPVTDRLNEIKAPTLIYWGEEDAPFERPSQVLRDSIANSMLVKIPGAGHSPHEEAPDAFNSALDAFLNKNGF